MPLLAMQKRSVCAFPLKDNTTAIRSIKNFVLILIHLYSKCLYFSVADNGTT